MTENKTKATAVDPREFIETIEHKIRKADALVLLDLFTGITGYKPKMWGPTMIGFGRYDYTYDSGRSGSSLATGFSPHKASQSIYIMPGYQDYSAIMERLGKHKMGKSCLYVNKLADIDLTVLEELIQTGLKDLNGYWPVHPE